MPGEVSRAVAGIKAQAPKTPSTGPVKVEVSKPKEVGERMEEEQPLTPSNQL